MKLLGVLIIVIASFIIFMMVASIVDYEWFKIFKVFAFAMGISSLFFIGIYLVAK